jgi:catechol 2,3-dioxygenase-like lactoylglutathione lyase family enzyme
MTVADRAFLLDASSSPARTGREVVKRERESTARVTSSVIFVSQLDRSVEFYRDVFSCEVTILDPRAALLLAPGGFQLYLIARGDRATHLLGGIGLQSLVWAVESDHELRDLARVLEDHGAYLDTFVSAGVSFIEARDPDGIRVLVAHPSPHRLPRSVLGSRLYA